MNVSNSWKRICFKTQKNLPQKSLTFFKRTATCGEEEEGEHVSLANICPQRQSLELHKRILPTQARNSKAAKAAFVCVAAPFRVSATKVTCSQEEEHGGGGAWGTKQPKERVMAKKGLSKWIWYHPLFAIGVSLLLLSGSLTVMTATKLLAQSIPLLNPTQPEAVEQLNQGLAFIQQGKLSDAIAAFQQASKLDPQLAAAHYNLGLALRQAGKLQESANAFYQATQADPNFAMAFANLGAALLEGNNLQQAGDYLSRALELDPNLGVAHYNYGLVLSQQGEPEKAIAHFKSAMQLSRNAPEPAYHIGLIYLQQGKIKEAKKAFQQALTINPQYPEAHYNIGSILFKEGDLNAALEAFRKAAQSNSNYANAYYGAGLVFLRQNRLSDAQKVLQYARDLYNAQGNPQWAAKAEQLLERSH